MILRPSLLLAALAVAGAAAPDATADTVQLRRAVRLDAGAEQVRLADVADLDGALAEAHADLVLAEAPTDDPVTIDVAAVRRALDAAGVHWGKVQLGGDEVVVRPRPNGPAQAPLAMTAISLERGPVDDAPDRVVRDGSDLVAEPTLAGAVARLVAEQLALPTASLRIAFRPVDADLLALDAAGRRFEIVPQSRLDGPRCELAIRTWRGGSIERRDVVPIETEVRRAVAVTVRRLRRGETIDPAAVTAAERWLAPAVAAAAPDAAGVAGRTAACVIEADTVLRPAMLEKDVVVRRGDPIVVRCLVGGLVVAVRGEARSEGAVGDVIECRKSGERDAFTATVAGPGEAVVDLERR